MCTTSKGLEKLVFVYQYCFFKKVHSADNAFWSGTVPGTKDEIRKFSPPIKVEPRTGTPGTFRTYRRRRCTQ